MPAHFKLAEISVKLKQYGGEICKEIQKYFLYSLSIFPKNIWQEMLMLRPTVAQGLVMNCFDITI